MVGVGLGELRKGENELSMKKVLLAVQITIELVVFLGIHNRDVMCLPHWQEGPMQSKMTLTVTVTDSERNNAGMCEQNTKKYYYCRKIG